MFKRYTSLLFPLLMASLALALLLSQSTTTAHPTTSTTITVNSSADLVADDGQCTLREAITAANSDSASGAMAGECPAGSGDDTIILSASTYLLTIAGAEEDNNATGDFDLTSNISIEVADGTATLDGNLLDRVLHIHNDATVSLSDVTITQGKTPDGIDGGAGESGTDAEHGGGVYNAGILSLTDVTLSNNRTGRGGFGGDGWFGKVDVGGNGGHAGQGGAIYNAQSGQLTMSNSSIIENMTGGGGHGGSVESYDFDGYPGSGGNGGAGGAIFNDGIGSLTNSIVSDNLAGGAGGAGFAWGFGALGGGGKSGSGGGIANLGMMMLTNNTISNNTTGDGVIGSPGGNGGGITNSGELILEGSLISQNRTGNGGDGGFEAGSPSSGGFGGGIHNTGLLSMTSSLITANLTGEGGVNNSWEGANAGFGGGLYNEGSMNIADSTISHNQTGNGGLSVEQGGAGGNGGGIHHAGTGFLSVINSTISHNMTGNGGDRYFDGMTDLPPTSDLKPLESKQEFEQCDLLFFSFDCGGDGGGIYHAGEGTVTLINSTVSNNITGNGGNVLEYTGQGGRAGDGGAIAHKGNGELILLTSTISGNRTGDGGNGKGGEDGGAGGDGAGIFNDSTLTISHSTIANNSTGIGGQGADGGNDGVDGEGGGIATLDEGNTTLSNTILVDNSAGNGPDCIGILSSQGYNLIQETTDCQLMGDMTGNLTDIPATLAPLADYGGPTFTHALFGNHPALDAGSCSEESEDQRHRPRPVDVSILPNADDGCDIGAYEAQFRESYLIKSVDDTTPQAGQLISYTITVSNIGATAITEAIISDSLPTGLTFAAPVTLSPPQAGAILAQEAADLPTLASNVTITPSSSITLTFPVTVSIGLAQGTSLTNIASITSSEVPTATVGAVTIRLPAPDLNLEQSLNRNGPFERALPGEPLTYSLAFSNIGNALATNIVLTDIVPAILSNVSITSTGAAITDTGATAPYVWEVADLAAGAGGIITITGVISPDISTDVIISNHAMIRGNNDIDITNNQEQINLLVELPQVFFDNSSVNVSENSSTANVLIRLYLENPYREVTVDYDAQNGTASAGQDYGIMGDSTPPSGTLTIENGSSIMLTIPILDDNIKEGHETILLSLSNPRGATLGFRESATLTILDDETPPTPTPSLTPTADFPTNTPIPSTPIMTPTNEATNSPTPTITPTSTPTITTQGVMDKLYLPLLFKN